MQSSEDYHHRKYCTDCGNILNDHDPPGNRCIWCVQRIAGIKPHYEGGPGYGWSEEEMREALEQVKAHTMGANTER